MYNISSMEILVNGRRESVDDRITLGTLIDAVVPAGKRVAVEVNEEIVPRARHAAHKLEPGDRVEIVQAIGGG
jgi:sulfur carrier protein